jgi:hypothetical protein
LGTFWRFPIHLFSTRRILPIPAIPRPSAFRRRWKSQATQGGESNLGIRCPSDVLNSYDS